jgi:Lamin Tail Domain
MLCFVYVVITFIEAVKITSNLLAAKLFLQKGFLMISRFLILLFLFCQCSLISAGQAAKRYEVLIDEFLADPSPSAGLPGSSFIELKNVSGRPINLRNWKLGDGNASATFKKDYVLKADSFLIVCPASAEAAYSAFGAAMGITGFPSLNHDADEVILSSDEGSVIHAVQYDKSWFRNDLKSGGGWSLEMIDPKNPCTGSGNWTASMQLIGGTPGMPNSVSAENPDQQGPDLLRTICPDSLHILALFSEPLDSLSASIVSNYEFSPDMGPPMEAIPVPPFYDQVNLTLRQPLLPEQVYTMSVQQVRDCAANEISIYNSCKLGLPQLPASGDLIFNEILFNPPSYGYDYIELYNRSRKTLDLQQVFLAGRDAIGMVKDPQNLVRAAVLFFPGEYTVLTENREWVIRNYKVENPDQLIRMSGLPSMPDDQGTILLLNEGGQILDELSYDHHWHFPLLANEEGVALERIQADRPTQAADNWASAASSAGFGTPTYKNSASFSEQETTEQISAEPKIFSPDNDGYQDYCFVKFHLAQPGLVANISIYDINGRMVRQLTNNSTLGMAGSFRWDGLDDGLNPLPTGHYVICVDLFSVDGKIKKYKLVETLARKY